MNLCAKITNETILLISQSGYHIWADLKESLIELLSWVPSLLEIYDLIVNILKHQIIFAAPSHQLINERHH